MASGLPQRAPLLARPAPFASSLEGSEFLSPPPHPPHPPGLLSKLLPVLLVFFDSSYLHLTMGLQSPTQEVAS